MELFTTFLQIASLVSGFSTETKEKLNLADLSFPLYSIMEQEKMDGNLLESDFYLEAQDYFLTDEEEVLEDAELTKEESTEGEDLTEEETSEESVEESADVDEFAEDEDAEVELSQEWYDTHYIVAHALGEIDGKTGSNSLEAFLSTYEKGVRVFEVDLQLTSDGHLVCRHDFDQNSYYVLIQSVLNGDTSMDLERFVNEKIMREYSSLTAEGLLNLLLTYDDAYIVTDTKDTDMEIVAEQFRQLVRLIEEIGDETLYDRVIVQVYNKEMYDVLSELYPFTHWIFTLYQIYQPDLEDIGAFCQENGIPVVTMPHESASLEKSEMLHGYGLKVYTHTVNLGKELIDGLEKGVDGFYSDFFTMDDYVVGKTLLEITQRLER